MILQAEQVLLLLMMASLISLCVLTRMSAGETTTFLTANGFLFRYRRPPLPAHQFPSAGATGVALLPAVIAAFRIVARVIGSGHQLGGSLAGEARTSALVRRTRIHCIAEFQCLSFVAGW